MRDVLVAFSLLILTVKIEGDLMSGVRFTRALEKGRSLRIFFPVENADAVGMFLT